MDPNTPAETPSQLGPMAEFGAALDNANERRAETPAETENSKDEQPKDDDNKAPKGAPDEAERARRAENNRNAQRRIQHRREQRNSQNRINELERQAQEREQAGDPDSAAGIRERIGDIQASVADAEYNDFYDRAVEEIGEGTEDFVQNTLRYSRYVNAAEPELQKIMARPKGLVVLKEWMRRMDVPHLREEWLQMLPSEKEATLLRFYQQITQGATKSATAPKSAKADVPVPGSGRNTKGVAPEDDFGLLLQEAKNRRLNSRR